MHGDHLRWWQRAVVYQVYPRSFADSDGDGVGDLRGIAGRLDHLEWLGADAVWLSPFYPSPMADFGYDVADYEGVDPLFGTVADAEALIDACHARGIRVIVDWVPNHTSDRHPWFLASRASRDDPKRDWYVWRDGRPGGRPPTDWQSAFRATGSAWTRDPATGQWYLHSFAAGQPDLNWENREVEAAMLDTLRTWLDRGVDGFRIDVVHELGKRADPGEGEGPWRQDQDWPRGHEIMRRVRSVLEEYDGDRVAVGEVYVLDQRRLARFLVTGDELHMAHNFVFLRTPWRADEFRAVIDEFTREAPPPAWPAWCLENHDHSRVASRHDEGGHGPARARAALVLLLTLRGTPFLFQGQELGLPDARIPPDRVVDIDGRDPERAPIPWEPPSEAGLGAGFTTGEPWLPVVEDAEHLAVSVQRDDPDSTLNLARTLLALRRETPALVAGDQRLLGAPAGVLAWERELDGDRIAVAVNMDTAEHPVAVAGAGVPGRLLASTAPGRAPGDVAADAVTLAPDEAVVVRVGDAPLPQRPPPAY
jgi:alpha-glucosidase